MTEHKIKLDLGRIGRSSDNDNWALIDKNDLDVWIRAEQLIQDAKYFHDGVEAKVHVDISKIIGWYKKHQKINKKFNEALKNREVDAWKLIPTNNEAIVLTAELLLTGENDVSSYAWYPQFFIEKYIYDVFFIMNMAVPGSCEFLNLRFKDKNDKDSERFYLSSYSFEEGYSDLLDNKKIAPIELPIQTVFSWYSELSIGTKQKAGSDIEKAIFSLLHLCKTDMDITSIIWIFHALEAIYRTKVGEGFTNLINRMTILLELNGKAQKEVKKHLRELYDYRSSFVHGGYKVHHPIRNEVIDKRLNDDYSRMYELGQIGFNLVVVSIQQLIKNHWFGIEVSEELKGIVYPSNQL